MEVNYMDNTVLNNPYLASQLMTDHIIKREKQYTLNNKTLGPFDYPNSDVKNFLNDILNFKVNYEFRTYVPYFYYNNYYCFSWVLIHLSSMSINVSILSKGDILKINSTWS